MKQWQRIPYVGRRLPWTKNGAWPLGVLLALLLLPVLAGTAVAAGPTKEECAKAGIEHPKKLVAFVVKLQKAVKDEDRAAVIAMMDGEYPVTVSVKGKDMEINTAADYAKHYDEIMTKPLRDSLMQLQMEDITCIREGALLSSDDDKRLFATEGSDGKFTYTLRP